MITVVDNNVIHWVLSSRHIKREEAAEDFMFTNTAKFDLRPTLCFLLSNFCGVWPTYDLLRRKS